MPNGDKTMKRISHIIHTTALKNAALPILSINHITHHNHITTTHLDKKCNEKHTTKKQNPFSKQHKQKGIALKKRGSTKTQRAKRTLFYEQK